MIYHHAITMIHNYSVWLIDSSLPERKYVGLMMNIKLQILLYEWSQVGVLIWYTVFFCSQCSSWWLKLWFFIDLSPKKYFLIQWSCGNPLNRIAIHFNAVLLYCTCSLELEIRYHTYGLRHTGKYLQYFATVDFFVELVLFIQLSLSLANSKLNLFQNSCFITDRYSLPIFLG